MVKQRTLLAVFLTTLAVFGLTSCGTTNHLQTLTLTAETSKSSSNLGGGLFNLVGEGGTLQLKVLANYSNKGSLDITNQVTYSITVTPGSLDAFGSALLTPPQTVTLNKTGMLTAVTPFDCTWVDLGTATQASWFLSGSYTVTATFRGVTSQPVYVSVASSAGPAGPSGSYACGPTS